MNVSDIKSRIQDYTGTYVTDTDAAARILRFINDARREIARKNSWNCLKKHCNIYLPADYSTGTVALASQGQTVTGTDTIWTSAMVGRYINFGTTSQQEYEWYRIVKVNSTTELVIDAPYVGSVALTASTYRIRKIYHRIPGDVSKLEGAIEFTLPHLLTEVGGQDMLRYAPDFHSTTGTPTKFDICGIYGREDTYTTGSITGTIATKAITGSGTAFLSNVVAGDKLVTGGYTYTVASVESDTAITLYQNLVAAAATASYTVTSNPDSMLVRFYNPTDRIAIIPFEYYHYPFDLLGDSDEDELTRRYGEVVVDYVVAKEKRAQDDSSWVTDTQKADATLRDAKAEGNPGGIWRPKLDKY